MAFGLGLLVFLSRFLIKNADKAIQRQEADDGQRKQKWAECRHMPAVAIKTGQLADDIRYGTGILNQQTIGEISIIQRRA